MVAKAAPDGYTVGVVAIAALAILPHLMKMPFDPWRDLVPVSKLSEGPIQLAASSKTPFADFRELANYAATHPGELKVAGYGVGSVNHLACLQIAKITRVDMSHVPYHGGRSR